MTNTADELIYSSLPAPVSPKGAPLRKDSDSLSGPHPTEGYDQALNLFKVNRILDMFAEYIQAALERAEYEMIDDPEPYYAHVPGLPGVWATGKTFEDCRKQLISVIEGWIVLGLRMGHPIPSIDGHFINVSRSRCERRLAG